MDAKRLHKIVLSKKHLTGIGRSAPNRCHTGGIDDGFPFGLGELSDLAYQGFQHALQAWSV